MKKKEKLDPYKIIKDELGFDRSVVQLWGVGALLKAAMAKRGNEAVTRCDADSRDGTAIEELLKDYL
jgi:hypothetical protein